MKLTKDLVAASAVPLVLSILGEGESYGYAIIQRVRALSGGAIEWTDGMLYPVLHRLEEQGLIDARWQESEAGRRRKYYTLKSAGRLALSAQKEQWLLVNATLGKLWGVQYVRPGTVY
jgi:PadR family transcriptional regulator PadR